MKEKKRFEEIYKQGKFAIIQHQFSESLETEYIIHSQASFQNISLMAFLLCITVLNSASILTWLSMPALLMLTLIYPPGSISL